MNDLVENLTCRNNLEVNIWNSGQKVVVHDRINLKIVMDEKFVKNFVMNEKFVKIFVKNKKLTRRWWWICTCLELVDGTICNPWMMIGIPNRDLFVTQYLERHSVSSDQHMKKLMSLREGLHVMMQCYMPQLFADRY